MKNFIFKSTDADLQKMFAILDTIQKNVLYMTYRTDTVLKTLNKIVTDKALQHQVDEYFDDEGHPNTPPNQAKDDLD